MSEGIYFIDKPEGWTSHDVVAKVRRLLGIRKVGHAGTLDPLATGLLIVLVGGQYTKRQNEFLKLDKEYVCTAQLGVTTDTYDKTGTVVRQAEPSQVAAVTPDFLNDILATFRGTITQTVPSYSAVKVGGKKLYDQARKGVTLVDLPQRQVTIHELELEDFTSHSENQTVYITLRVRCSSGTYIRSLVHDIGQALGVGAMVTALRRTSIGQYDLSLARHLQTL